MTPDKFRKLRKKLKKQCRRLADLNTKLNALRVELDDQIRTIHARLDNVGTVNVCEGEKK